MNVFKRNAWVLLRPLCLSAFFAIILSESLVDAKANDRASRYQPLSKQKIQESIEQLRAFENSDLKDTVFELSKAREERRKENPIPESVVKRELTAADLEGRALMSAEEKEAYWEQRQKSHETHTRAVLKDYHKENIDPQLRHKVSRIEEGMYSVYAVFINDQNFPEKYGEHRVFKINQTKEYADKWRETILNYYFGESYQANKPQLRAIHDLVTMRFLVSGSDELERILEGKSVKSLTHAGLPFEEIEYYGPER